MVERATLLLIAAVCAICTLSSVTAQQFPVYDGFSAAEVAAVGSSDRWRQYYRDNYYSNVDHFSPVTLTGFISTGDDHESTPLLRLVGVADQLSISPLLTGSPVLHDKAMSLGVQPGLSGNAASGERAKALNAFRTRGVLIVIRGEEIVSMAQECATVLPFWNISSSSSSTTPLPFLSIRLTSLYKSLTRMLASSGGASSSPLLDIRGKVKSFNNDNTKGTAADNSGSALEMPLSLVIEESSPSSTPPSSSVSNHEDTILGYLRTPANAATAGMSCLLAQIRFSDPPLYSYSPDGLVAQTISSIAVADGSFNVLLGLRNSNESTYSSTSGQMLGSSKFARTQKVVQEFNRMDALGFHSQVSSISYFKTRSTVGIGSTSAEDNCTSSSTLFCRLFIQRSAVGGYVAEAAANFVSLLNRGFANMREVFDLQGYGSPAYKKGSAASLRPVFVQESKANMYLSSNAPVQGDASVGVTLSASSSPLHEETPRTTENAPFAAPETQQHSSSSSSAYSSSPNCLEQPSPTCSLQGGLNIWGTTYLPPSTTNTTTNSLANETMMPNGSIAILVPISSGGMFHDNGIPGASSVAPDLAAVLAAIDAMSSTGSGGSIISSLLQNSSMLGHLYFFFLTGEEYGFMGSGRLVKEMENFNCSIGNGRATRQRNNINESTTPDTAVDCEFPYYWFTNFTSINLDQFSHFISLEGVLDDLAVDDVNATVPFYAYTDSRLSSPTGTSTSSPNQVLVNELLSQMSTLGETSQQHTKFNISLVNFNDIVTGGSNSATNGVIAMNASFQVLSVSDVSVPTSSAIPPNGSCAGPSALFNLSIRTTIPPCSLWPLMASRTLTTASASDLIATYEQQPLQDGTIDYLPRQWRSKSFTLITSRPPQIFVPAAFYAPDSAAGHVGLDTSYPYLKGTLDTAANLLEGGGNVASSTHLRFDRVTSITHAASEILATLLTALIKKTSSDNPSTSIVLNHTEKVNWTEVGRLWYCFGANINCEDGSNSDLLVSPNYYAGVFSYRWSISNVQAYVTSYTALRLTPTIDSNHTVSVDDEGCSSDAECGSVYKSCQPTRMISLNTTTAVMRCQYQRVQYTHSFSLAAEYDPNHPSLSRFVLDTTWISAPPFTLSSITSQNSVCMWSNSLQLFDNSNAVAVSYGGGSMKRQHMVAVESYWGGDGIGIRSAAYLPPTSHYLSLMGGLVVLGLSLVGGVVAMRLDAIVAKISMK